MTFASGIALYPGSIKDVRNSKRILVGFKPRSCRFKLKPAHKESVDRCLTLYRMSYGVLLKPTKGVFRYMRQDALGC